MVHQRASFIATSVLAVSVVVASLALPKAATGQEQTGLPPEVMGLQPAPVTILSTDGVEPAGPTPMEPQPAPPEFGGDPTGAGLGGPAL